MDWAHPVYLSILVCTLLLHGILISGIKALEVIAIRLYPTEIISQAQEPIPHSNWVFLEREIIMQKYKNLLEVMVMWRRLRICTVSYTHLDVYKRQVSGGAWPVCSVPSLRDSDKTSCNCHCSYRYSVSSYRVARFSPSPRRVTAKRFCFWPIPVNNNGHDY